jgi:hypothetical protein
VFREPAGGSRAPDRQKNGSKRDTRALRKPKTRYRAFDATGRE